MRGPSVIGRALAVALVLAQGSVAHAASIAVTLAVESVQPPPLFGYSIDQSASAQYYDWYRYTRATSARIWSSPGCIQTYDPVDAEWMSRWDFIQYRQQLIGDLRAHPGDYPAAAQTRHVDWAAIRNAYRHPLHGCGDPTIDIEAAFQALDHLGVDPIVVVPANDRVPLSGVAGTRDPEQLTRTFWWDRWFLWRNFFVQAYYLGREHGVSKYEFINEPEGSPYDTDQIYERMYLASDAIRHAVSEVNVWRAAHDLSPLTPEILCAAFTHPFINNETDGGHDYEIRRFLVEHRRSADFYGYSLPGAWGFPGQPGGELFSAFSYHAYTSNVDHLRRDHACDLVGGAACSPAVANVETLASIMRARGDTANVPVYLTETNSLGGALAAAHNWGFAQQDTPGNAVRMGLRMHAISEMGLRGANLHKFELHRSYGGGEKASFHGLFWTSDGKIGGATRSGEVARLYAEGFAGARQRLKLEAIGTRDANFAFEAARDLRPNADRYYILSTNNHCHGVQEADEPLPGCDPTEPDQQHVTIDFSGWPGVVPGTQIMIKEVSAQRRGEVLRFYTVDDARQVVFVQPAQSVQLLIVPNHGARQVVTQPASADAYVRDGQSRSAYFGERPRLMVQASVTDANQRFVSFIQTGLPQGWSPADVDMAVLKVTGRSGSESRGSGQAVVHVYGIDDDAWAAAGHHIHWSTAPNLPDTRSMTSVDTIAENFLKSAGTSAHILGSITADADGPSDERLDVTDYVRSQNDGVASFMLIREVRYDRDESTQKPADVASASFWMASRENETPGSRPALELVRR